MIKIPFTMVHEFAQDPVAHLNLINNLEIENGVATISFRDGKRLNFVLEEHVLNDLVRAYEVSS